MSTIWSIFRLYQLTLRRSFNSALIDPERIVQAVFDVDATILDNSDSMDVDEGSSSSIL